MTPALLRDNVEVSQEGLVTSSDQNHLIDAASIILCVFMLGLKYVPHSCTIKMAPGSFRALWAAVPTFPVNYPSALLLLLLGGSSRKKVDGVKSPLMPHFIQFAVFFLYQINTFAVSDISTQRNPPVDPVKQRSKNSQARQHLQDPLLLLFPKCCFVRKLD